MNELPKFKITDDDIFRAYDACAIIRVCELAAEQIPELAQDALVHEAVGDIRRLLAIAGKIAAQSLTALELAQMSHAHAA
ncbi:hypothetical protein D3227_27240 [Mesorhizobium waimense]|uniref:Uncharacterized protein n=1 Tax=Mesorhizobium waimense TaxID=1300307 RepID=A0A3A5KAX7_9HYPH|nr:hypothetical protein [Mesorhizobium waimense]RJT32098.1 hypothetical protein D3227_27240 [Mesorhizobium waimense]